MDDFKGLETNWEWKANERGMTNRISHKPQQYVTTIKKEIGNCTFTKQNNNNKLDKNHVWTQVKSSVITYNWKDTWILLFWLRLPKNDDSKCLSSHNNIENMFFQSFFSFFLFHTTLIPLLHAWVKVFAVGTGSQIYV